MNGSILTLEAYIISALVILIIIYFTKTKESLNRIEFAGYIIPIGIFLFIWDFLLPFNFQIGRGSPALFLFQIIAIIFSAYFAIKFSIERLNNIGRSKYLVLISIVPFVGFLFGLYLFFWKGQEPSTSFD
ncbi:DUF805 domain-containing protein [Nisaea sp.]|uniref:DUF805 domain-containing protein n=1 Tax=Nisaea sp. TaxID=2024842 RepID=UPI002B2662BF|nr:DUF805 domain-containing protein [Nisaea sp.]